MKNIFVVLLFAAAGTLVPAEHDHTRALPKWEYKLLSLRCTGDFNEVFAAGREGWELVAFQSFPTRIDSRYITGVNASTAPVLGAAKEVRGQLVNSAYACVYMLKRPLK